VQIADRFHWLWMRCQVFVFNLFGFGQQSVQCLRVMLQLRPDDFFVLSTLAHFLGQQRQTRPEAIALLRKALLQQANHAALHFNLGFLLEQQGLLAEAESSFRVALRLNDKLDRAWYGLGLVFIQQGRTEEAVQALKRNTELQPMSPFGWYQLARLHLDRQETEQALEIIRHLQGFEPKIAEQLKRETGLKP
jgi:tetratricopeptide (TPR) repeat protein